MKSIMREFRQFAMRGNVMDLAVAVIIGAAFNKIVTSIVNDLVMPPIGLMLGKVKFQNLFIVLGDGHYETLEQAKEANVPTLNYGLFINTVMDFVIIAFVVFLVVKKINYLKNQYEHQIQAIPADQPVAAPTEMVEPTSKVCPHCYSEIPIKSTRCKFCTSHLIDVNIQARS